MDKHYPNTITKVFRRTLGLLILFLLALPFLSRAQSLSLSPTAGGTSQNFGSVAVGSTSASYSFLVMGSNLSDDVTIVIPQRFEGSTNNTTFSNASIYFTPDAGGNVFQVIYLRFKPTTTGAVNRNLTAFTYDINGDVVNSSPAVALSGTGTPGTPTITASPTALGFGNQTTGTTSSPMNLTVTGTSLTAAITVTAPSGFLVSTGGGAYGSSVSLTPTSGAVNTTVSVEFAPTAAQNYVSNITLTSSGATTQNISASGTGVLPTPTLTIAPTSLTYGSQAVGTNSASQPISVSGQNLQGNVTITPPAGFQISRVGGLFTTSALTLTPTSGTLTSTQINVRFSPTLAQTYTSAPLQITSTNAASATITLNGQGTAAAAGAHINIDPSSNTIDFGTVTSSGSADTRFFQVNATGLNDNLVLTPNSVNILIRNASAGGTFQNSPLSISPVNGIVTTQSIEVQLVSMVPAGSFSQTISLTSPGTTPTAPTPEIVTVTASNPSGTISDISLVDPSSTGTDFTFVTRPTTTSATKTILVSGTNLLQALVIQPVGTNAQYFQVSATGNANDFSSQLSFMPNAQGSVIQRPVYIRFVPGTSALTVTAAVRATSAPASYKEVSVTGISEPTLRLNQAIGNFGDAVVVKSSAAGVRTVRADGFLLGGTTVDLRFPSEIDASGNPTAAQYEFSIDGGTTYMQSATLSLDAQGNFTQSLTVRYAPSRVGSAVQDLEFRNVSLNNGGYFTVASGYGQASGFAIAVEPGAQSTAVMTRNGSSATINFNLTDQPVGTYGQNRLVIGTTVYNQLPQRIFPQDKQNFNPGTTVNGSYVFGSGTPLDGSAANAQTGTFVVFSGGSNTFTVTDLDPNATYYFYSFEFNDDGVLNAENYRVPNNQPATAIQPPAPLPVELLYFTAKPKDGKVQLNWATASEKNNNGFAVERSADAQTFTTVLTKEGQGTTSARTDYSAVDAKPLTGLSYYRLKQTDFDGKTVYTPVVAVRMGSQGEFSLYPNPTQDVLHIVTANGLTENVAVRITELTGRVAIQTRLGSEGTISLKALPTGTYLVTVGEGQQQVTRRVTKN